MYPISFMKLNSNTSSKTQFLLSNCKSLFGFWLAYSSVCWEHIDIDIYIYSGTYLLQQASSKAHSDNILSDADNWTICTDSIIFNIPECLPEYHWIHQSYIVYEHWTDTREFITRTAELWNRWIRLSSY